MRRDFGHIASLAFVSPTAPSVVIVAGVCSPRFTKSRSTSRQLSELSLWVVERPSNTLRPSTQIAQTHNTPVLEALRKPLSGSGIVKFTLGRRNKFAEHQVNVA